jgi:hypothetical protein
MLGIREFLSIPPPDSRIPSCAAGTLAKTGISRTQNQYHVRQVWVAAAGPAARAAPISRSGADRRRSRRRGRPAPPRKLGPLGSLTGLALETALLTTGVGIGVASGALTFGHVAEAPAAQIGLLSL